MKQYTFSNLISGREYDYNLYQWIDTPIEKREKALELFRAFLLETCRKNSSFYNAINYMTIDNLPNNYGIFERLIIDEDRDRVQYIAGQEYDGEIKCIKELIRKHC
jgi:hypothetical protein